MVLHPVESEMLQAANRDSAAVAGMIVVIQTSACISGTPEAEVLKPALRIDRKSVGCPEVY